MVGPVRSVSLYLSPPRGRSAPGELITPARSHSRTRAAVVTTFIFPSRARIAFCANVSGTRRDVLRQRVGKPGLEMVVMRMATRGASCRGTHPRRPVQRPDGAPPPSSSAQAPGAQPAVPPPGAPPLLGGAHTAFSKGRAPAFSNYANRGRYQILTDAEEKAILNFVKKWRHKRFCVSHHIRVELKLKCSAMTVTRCLNRHGYFWRAVAKKALLKPKDIDARKAFVEKYGAHTPAWWQKNLHRRGQKVWAK